MQTKELSIEIPKGYEIDSFDKVTGKIKFKEVPKSVLERIRTTMDVLTALGENDPDVIIYRKLVEVFGYNSHVTNNQMAVCITKSLNEGWEPNWDDSSYKYWPYFVMGSSGFRYDDCDYWLSRSLVGSRLCFKTLELAEYAGNTFTEVYKKFMLIE